MCIWYGFVECFIAGIGCVLDMCIWSDSVECFMAGIV